MELITVFCATLVGAGVYSTSSSTLELHEGGRTISCHSLEPGATFEVEGPATAKVQLWVDLPAKPPKPKPLGWTLELDGKAVKHKLAPKRAKGASYSPARELAPSAAAKAVALKLEAGRHTLVVTLPDGRSGCVALHGLERRAAQPEAAVAAAPAAAAPSASAEPAESVAAEPAAAEPEATAAAATPALEPTPESATAIHEVRATSVDAAPAVMSEQAAPEPKADSAMPLLRLGLKGGGYLPRGDLKAGGFIGLLLEAPLAEVAGAQLGAYFEGGWSPMRQQDEVMLEGRGQAQLIQNSLVLPFELGARARLDLGLPLIPYGVLGLAVDVVRTELRVYSDPPVRQNDVALGIAAALGAALPVGPVQLIAELRYREVSADMGSFDEAAEPTLASTALHLGVVAELDR